MHSVRAGDCDWHSTPKRSALKNAMLHFIVQRIPRKWLQFFGRLQFTLPILKVPINWIGARIAASEGIIKHGVGSGLRFCAQGGYPGYLLGTSNAEEQEVLKQNLREKGVFYDIGANIGFYATIAAKLVGSEGKVFAFEPFAASAEACRRNAKLNNFTHVTVVDAAVAAKEGQMTLELGESSAVHRLTVGENGRKVRVVTIDQWRTEERAPAPDLVMIDVEGAELDVLHGMLETLKEARPTIMVEVHWRGDAFFDFFSEHLNRLGYQLTTYAGEAPPLGFVRYHALIRCDERKVGYNLP